MTENATREIAPHALELLVGAVARIGPAEWDRDSNLDGWSVRDVVAHVTGSVAKIATLVEDSPASRSPSDPATWRREDPVAELRTRVDAALALLPDAPLEAPRQSPAGQVPLGTALSFPLVDAVVHAWDLDRSCGRALEVPDDLLGFVRGLVERLGDVADKSPDFASPQPCPDDATPTQRIMARLGRSVI